MADSHKVPTRKYDLEEGGLRKTWREEREPSSPGSQHGSLSSLQRLDTQEEALARLANPMSIVSSILVGALLAIFLNPPQTVYQGVDNSEWIGCCKDMPDGTCDRFATALVAFLFLACVAAVASLCFIVAASLKAMVAAGRADKLEGSTAAIACFIASKWTLFICVYLTYVVMLLYTPIAYPLSILILVSAVLGVGTVFTALLLRGHFWRDVKQDMVMLADFMVHKKFNRFLTIKQHSAIPMDRQ